MLSPVITVTVSLVLVAAIGYVVGLLRGRRLSAREPAEGARRRLAEADLVAARDAQERQGALLDRATAERASAAAECDSLRTAIEAARVETERTASLLELRDEELGRTRQQLEEAAAELARSPQAEGPLTSPAEEQIEERLHERDERIARLRSDMRELEERYASQVHERDVELADVRQSADERATELEEARAALVHARAQLEERRGELGAVRSAMGAAHTQRRQLEEDSGRQHLELETLRLALAEARQETAALEQGYRAQIEQRAARSDELQAAQQRAEERCAELQSQLQDRSHKLEEALDARGQAESRASEREQLSEVLQAELRDALQHSEMERIATHSMLAEVTATGQHAQAEFESVRLELEDTTELLRQKEAAFVLLQREHDEHQEKAARGAKERSLEIDHLTRTITSRTSALEHAQTAVQTATARAEAMQQALEAEQTLTHTAQETLAAREDALQETHTELSHQAVALEATRSELIDAESRAERRLRERTLEAERVTTLLHGREEEFERATRIGAALQEQVKHEEERCATRDQRISVLEQELQRLLDVRDRMLREVHDRDQQVRQLRALVQVAPADHDDLEVIDGIGPSIAALLRSLGVRSYREIAAWDQRTMDWLTAREPQLKGRLRREWIEAAAAAHAAKYDQPPD